jgi:hypothetical protein
VNISDAYIRVLKSLQINEMLQSAGHAVGYMVKALCYNPEGRGFEANDLISIYLILPAELGL